jgi:hypothetical protein
MTALVETPITCPVCGDIMLTKYEGLNDKIMTKGCSQRLDHYMQLFSFADTNEVYGARIRISTKPLRYATWNFQFEDLSIVSDSSLTWHKLPYFYPNLTNYSALVSKIKIFILFS